MGLYRHIRIAAAMLLSLSCAGGAAWQSAVAAPPAVRESRYRMAPFGTVHVYSPAHGPRGVVLFLSGDGGWDRPATVLAHALADQGLLVAGVSTPSLMQTLEQNKAKCIDPNYPLVDLARDVQHRMAVRAYMKPIVVGYSAGATVAYASLAQWPNGGYRGVLSIGFSADLPGHKHWCAAPGFVAHPITRPTKGWMFAPSKRIKVPWTVLQGQADAVVSPSAARRFVSAIPHARYVELPKVGHGFAVTAHWLPQLRSEIDRMLPAPIAAGPLALPDMPLTIVPSTVPARPGGNADTMAVIYSGDGGWVGIDRDVAQHLASAGIPVVGVDSLSYFWSQRTPSGAAADLDRVIASFTQRWHRPKVLLIGYSFGADTLPHIVGALNPQTRSRIASISLLGLSPTADFQFHLTSWLNVSSAQALPTVPAVAALHGMTIRCIRGVAESDSACPAIPRGVAQNYVVPGGHHFDRNSALLASIILGQRPAGIVQS
ncbi:AcvB/VirJ family lysyl-phosphatidylglycerol hydrolase [Sphingobium sp. CECT 9361]|uniref:AcvB/VirJ family lysyl-phosphatidylglycerol hydrolase n=1 Tax=Sphingobium sp. CECT 9361 TaxID=2845384 RepID=UPI001E5CF27F|nr:AcvB/VirJ family lysyl-phosphatidylglycerol hydrolase [Sphingobium sp. CECT 9361]CAH0348816.1 hypothetical protein SPH9361_00292 [Sphingobium sp. CECT 9361]